jgi:hypothetical protein
MMIALLLAAAAPASVTFDRGPGNMPLAVAEPICELAAKAQARGETDFWPRVYAEFRLREDQKIALLSFCLGRSRAKLEATGSRR